MRRTHLQHTICICATHVLTTSAQAPEFLQGTCTVHGGRSFDASLQHELLLHLVHGQNSKPRCIAPWIGKALHPPLVKHSSSPVIALPLAAHHSARLLHDH